MVNVMPSDCRYKPSHTQAKTGPPCRGRRRGVRCGQRRAGRRHLAGQIGLIFHILPSYPLHRHYQPHIPTGCRTNISGVLAEDDDLLSLPLSSRGGEGSGATASESRDERNERAAGRLIPAGSRAGLDLIVGTARLYTSRAATSCSLAKGGQRATLGAASSGRPPSSSPNLSKPRRRSSEPHAKDSRKSSGLPRRAICVCQFSQHVVEIRVAHIGGLRITGRTAFAAFASL